MSVISLALTVTYWHLILHQIQLLYTEGKNDPACHQKTDMASGNSLVTVSCLSASKYLVEKVDLSASGLLSVSSEQK
jgi:hypothetical protein